MASSHATCSDRGEGGEMFDTLDDCCYDSEGVEVGGLGGRIVRRGFRMDGWDKRIALGGSSGRGARKI